MNVAVSAFCGAGGPAGTPFFWMKAKLTGSSQYVLHCAKPVVHSRLSMVSAAHQCVSSQLALSTNGGVARRVKLHLHERRAAAALRGCARCSEAARRVRVGVGRARRLRVGVRVADGHREPRRRGELEPVRDVAARADVCWRARLGRGRGSGPS